MGREKEKQFNDAYRSHKETLLNYLFYRLGNWHNAEDMAHDTFLKTWIYLEAGNNVENIKSFLYKVAHNLLVDYYRRKKHQPIPIDISKFANRPDTRFSNMQAEIINKVLVEKYIRLLKREHRKIMAMRYINNMGIKQISDRSGYSRNHTRVILHRAGKILKRKFLQSEQKTASRRLGPEGG